VPTSLDDVIEELQFVSNRISEQTRTIALSVLAVVWLFVASGEDAPVLPTPPSKNLLLAAGGLAFLCLLLDYLQYVLGYFATDHVRKTAEKAGTTDALYEYGDWRYRMRTGLFWGKQAVVLGSVACLATAILRCVLM
jgi:hypothetical protein